MRIRLHFACFAACSLSTLGILAACAAPASAGDQAHLSDRPFETGLHPRLYASTLSLYGMASDFERTVDLRLAMEWPFSDRTSILAGLRRRSFTPAAAADGDGLSRKSWGLEAAVRMHPWEWMPGFFVQTMGSFEMTRADNLRHSPHPKGFSLSSDFSEYDETVRWVDRAAYEGGLGYGYVWRLGRLAVELQCLFGPRIWEEVAHARWIPADGRARQAERRDEGWDEMLRFRDLRIGLIF